MGLITKLLRVFWYSYREQTMRGRLQLRLHILVKNFKMTTSIFNSSLTIQIPSTSESGPAFKVYPESQIFSTLYLSVQIGNFPNTSTEKMCLLFKNIRKNCNIGKSPNPVDFLVDFPTLQLFFFFFFLLLPAMVDL